MTAAEAVSILRGRGLDVRFMGGADSMMMCRYQYPGTSTYVAFAIARGAGVWMFSHMGPGQSMTERPTPLLEEALGFAFEYFEQMRPRES